MLGMFAQFEGRTNRLNRMSDNVAVAIVSASGAVIAGVAGLVANVVWIGRSFDLLKESMNQRLSEVERRLGVIEAGIKEFFKIRGEHFTDIRRLKDKAGLQ
jgi:hypothetical protein